MARLMAIDCQFVAVVESVAKELFTPNGLLPLCNCDFKKNKPGLNMHSSNLFNLKVFQPATGGAQVELDATVYFF